MKLTMHIHRTGMKMLNASQPVRKAAGHSRGLHAFRWLSQWGPVGIFAIAIIDFSIIPLPLPNITDLLLLWLTSRGESPWVLIPSAVAGATVGAYTTWHIGWKGGRTVLRRYLSLPSLDLVFRWIERHPILAALLFPLLPPPIPLTPLVLACGAAEVARRRFFLAFSTALSLRYALIAWLGKTYGHHIVQMWVWVLRKWSGPLLWLIVALLVGAVVLGIWRTYIRNRGALPKTQTVEAGVATVD